MLAGLPSPNGMRISSSEGVGEGVLSRENVRGKSTVCPTGAAILKPLEDFGRFPSGENFALRSENVCSLLPARGVPSLLRSEAESPFNVGVRDGGPGITMLERMLVLSASC